MKLIRMLVILSLKFNIMLKSEHILGVWNSIADGISRCRGDHFNQLALNQEPTSCQVSSRCGGHLSSEIKQLLAKSMASRSWRTYNNAWK